MKLDQKSRLRAKNTRFKKNIERNGYGWRQSVHADWILRNEETIAGLSGWAVEVENFFRVTAQHDPERVMRICSVSKNGSLTAEHFVGFTEHFTIAQVLMDLSEQEDCNLMFDPIPWVHGKRPRKTRFGFRTVTVGHPFDYYPSPSIFWSVGRSAYQSMTVLPGDWSNREVNEVFGGVDGGCKLTSKLSRLNLLYVPGSEILLPDRAPFSSEVQFDEITEWCDDGKEWRWTKY